MRILTLLALITLALPSFATPTTSPFEYFSESGMVVTEAGYPRAETARQMINAQARAGGVNRFIHKPTLTLTEDQPVVRMNRDSYYSSAVVDVSAGATITLPELPPGKYMSMQPITEDHRTQPMSYDAGTYELATHTGSHVYIILRMDSTFTEAEVARYREGVTINAASAHPFAAEPVQRESFYATENALKAQADAIVARFGPAAVRLGMFTAPTDNSRAYFHPEIHQFASAAAWGGAQIRDNVYEFTPNRTAEGCYQATFEDPQNDAFWSFTVYNDKGYLFDDVAHINSNEATANPDGTYTVSMGCGLDAPNRIPISNESGVFNVTVRHYRPSQRVFEGYRLAPNIKRIQN